jgi:hypothetical protein
LETSNLLLVAGKYFEILMSLKYFFSLLLGCLKNFSSEVCTNFSLMMEFLNRLASSGRSRLDEQKSFHFSPGGTALTLEA